VCSMCIKVMLEVEELVQIGRRPEKCLIETLSSDCADHRARV
jgi:hypothetical protein